MNYKIVKSDDDNNIIISVVAFDDLWTAAKSKKRQKNTFQILSPTFVECLDMKSYQTNKRKR